MCSLIFWRYEKFARSPKKLLDKQVVVRLENNEENARYAVLVIMLVMRVFFARYVVNRGVVNRGRSVYIGDIDYQLWIYIYIYIYMPISFSLSK